MVKGESLVRIRTEESMVALPKSKVLVEVKLVLKTNSVAKTEVEMNNKIEITAQKRKDDEEEEEDMMEAIGEVCNDEKDQKLKKMWWEKPKKRKKRNRV